jgi:hypothetical protein
LIFNILSSIVLNGDALIISVISKFFNIMIDIVIRGEYGFSEWILLFNIKKLSKNYNKHHFYLTQFMGPDSGNGTGGVEY